MALTIKDQSDTLGTLTLPPQLQSSFERAFQLQRDGDWAQARSLYEAILERHPGHLDTLQCLGAVAIGSGEAAPERLAQGPFGAIVATGFTIVGWVAMWRPLEIYLYDWWPVREERLNYERLARMQVRLVPPG